MAMDEITVDPVQNIAPPIDAVPTSAALDGTPKKRNYLFWILGISALIVIFFTSLLILSGNQKKIEKNPAVINEPKVTSETPVAIDNPELIEFVRGYLKRGAETQFKIEKVEGNYAYGTGGIENAFGFYWAAAKKNGEWNYAFGGNGIPECKEVEIFPVGTFKLVGQGGKFDDCYNDKSELIDRKTGFLVK